MSNDYKVDSIKVLSDLQHIRLRPGMYVGEMNVPPIALFNEAIDNALDESQAADVEPAVVKVSKQSDGKFKYSIRDYGRGIPIGKVDLPNGGSDEALRVLIMTTNSGAKFNSNVYRNRTGLHGLGMACVCALSEYMHVITYRDGKSVEFESSRGEEINLTYNNTKEPNGVLIEFVADSEMWQTTEVPFEQIEDRCRISKSMGYRVRLFNENSEIQIEADSILDTLPKESDNSIYFQDIIRAEDPKTGESLLVGFRYTSDTKSKIIGFTNLLPNRYGGTHTRLITDKICDAWSEIYKDSAFQWGDATLGIRVSIAAFINEIAFSSQTKEKLTVPYKQLEPLGLKFKEQFKKWILDHKSLSDKIVSRFVEYRQSLIKLQNQKDISNKVKIAEIDSSGKTRRSQIVNGLLDCTSTSRKDTELFLCEGLSASGVIARPRDRKTQAVLPLRGKIQNIAGMSVKDALKHETVLNIINAIGAGVSDAADPNKSRYERIITSTDADPDGCHITALILTTLVNLLGPLVKAGMVYVLDPPLYKYEIDGKPIYTSDFESIPSNAKHFIRFKGLGAMEDEDFKNTCLNKENRTLYQIQYPDDIDEFNRLTGTSWGRSELLKRYGVIRDQGADITEEESDE